MPKKNKRSLAKGATLKGSVPPTTPKGPRPGRQYKPLTNFYIPALADTQETVCLTSHTPDGPVIMHYLYTDADNPNTIESLRDLQADMGKPLGLIAVPAEIVHRAVTGVDSEEDNDFASEVDVVFIDDSVAIPMTRVGADFLVKAGDPKPWNTLDDEQLRQEAMVLFALYVSKVEGITVREAIMMAKEKRVRDEVLPPIMAALSGTQADPDGWLQGPPESGSYVAKVQRLPDDTDSDLLIFDKDRTFGFAVAKDKMPLLHAKLLQDIGNETRIYCAVHVNGTDLACGARIVGQDW